MTLVVEIVHPRPLHSTLIVAHDKNTATPEEWQDALERIKECIGVEHGVDKTIAGLVASDGGTLNLQQRSSLKQLIGERRFPLGVMSASPAVKLVVTGMSWFNSEMGVFSTKDSLNWLAHGALSPTPVVLAALNKLNTRVQCQTLSTALDNLRSRGLA